MLPHSVPRLLVCLAVLSKDFIRHRCSAGSRHFLESVPTKWPLTSRFSCVGPSKGTLGDTSFPSLSWSYVDSGITVTFAPVSTLNLCSWLLFTIQGELPPTVLVTAVTVPRNVSSSLSWFVSSLCWVTSLIVGLLLKQHRLKCPFYCTCGKQLL